MLISIDEATRRYDKTHQTLYSSACIYKKENGSYPKWYISSKESTKIDTHEFEYQGTIERQAWLYATDILFWLLTDKDEGLGHNVSDISRGLAENSKLFTSVSSWMTFFSTKLFRPPPYIISNIQRSMLLEFILVGTKLACNLPKKGNKCLN